MPRTLIYLFAIILAGVGVFLAAREHTDQRIAREAEERLGLYEASIQNALERWAHLPLAVAQYGNAKQLTGTARTDRAFSSVLKTLNDAAGSDALYIMNADGLTVASSNHDLPGSFLGRNYSFRPYFSDAMQGGQGRFFAVGATTGRPGYFISSPIVVNGSPRGVAVVKTEFADLLSDWQAGEEQVFVTDQYGVIILASDPEYSFRSLRNLSDGEVELIQQTRRYGNFSPTLLAPEFAADEAVGSVFLDGENLAIVTRNISEQGWRLHLLYPTAAATNTALGYAAVTIMILGLGFAFWWIARARQRQRELEIKAADAEAIRLINTRLENEVESRKQTEYRLRDTQAQLIQSSRLVALGKMSAAIVHEVNQPVSAIRNYTSSGLLLLKERRLEEAGEVLANIRAMTERLGMITSDLLVFSRKPVAKPKAVSIAGALDVALELNRADMEADALGRRVLLSYEKPDPLLCVRGSRIRMEQLFSNLIKNARQASTSNKAPDHVPQISISSHVVPTDFSDKGDLICIEVSDNGTGISEEVMDQLFDPFFTTKPVGEGVGLGLALSYAIVDEAGGRLTAANNARGGATFKVELPLLTSTSSKKVEAREQLA